MGFYSSIFIKFTEFGKISEIISLIFPKKMYLCGVKQKWKAMVIDELVEKQMISRMRLDNPWWSSGVIREDFKALMPRAYLDSFHSMVSNMGVKRAFILMVS